MTPEKGPNKPKNLGEGEKHTVKKGPSLKDKKTMNKLLKGTPGYKPYKVEAQKGQKKAKETAKKLKKGTEEYKAKLAELTDIDIDSANDRMKDVKIAGADTTQAEIEGRPTEKAPDTAVAKNKPKKAPSSGNKREGLV